MKYMGLGEIREKYLSFFESKGHLRLGSFSLVPNNDKSLLLINSGMAPMKKYFTGEVTPPCNRITTCQKCIRTPDLERVGHTARHGTYFEMLGNFSFGDYFKTEAIQWAWEFLTKELEIPEHLLWPSIYESDDEAFDIWKNIIGVPEERIVRLGKADNFWEHGTGPCGPCSEIYFDRGEKYDCGSPDCKPGCECDRYMEIWNNVFSQFNNMGDGTYTELTHKNIDTGMGLERLACVMQDVDNMFEVDTIRKILDYVCSLSGVRYGEDKQKDISIRAITDHARAATFMISDGIIPSNEGRGYVLRRLIRRAARHGKMIGINKAFLPELCDVVIAENKDGYPELVEKQQLIKKVISFEEAAFSKTIDQGLALLEGLTQKGGMLSGEDAFKLYDTYGFPLDLTKDILSEKGMTLDEDGFKELMQKQRELARSSRKAADAESWKSNEISFDGVGQTEFVGYTQTKTDANIVGIAVEGEVTDMAGQDARAVIVLDKTVFYGESGGQIGDVGLIVNGDNCFVVEDTKKTAGDLFTHFGYVKSGIFSVGDTVSAEIDKESRDAIRRNHTAAHLLQAALRAVLGTHVEQAGQLVTAKSVRFDFTHFSALSAEEVGKVESIVNAAILDGKNVDVREMPIDEAKKMGAMALFGEKYGETVRVVNVEGVSVELCGGTHIDNAAKIGLFKIISESGVASGVRRIEALTGTAVLNRLSTYENILAESASVLKVNQPSELAAKCKTVLAEGKEKDKKIAALEEKLAEGSLAELLDKAISVANVRVIAGAVDAKGDALRRMAEKLRDKAPDAVIALIGKDGTKATVCVACGKETVAAGMHAGKIASATAALTGGKGGGKPDMAMAGVGNITKIDVAVAGVKSIVEEML